MYLNLIEPVILSTKQGDLYNMGSEVYIGTVLSNCEYGDVRNTEVMGRVLVLIRGKTDIEESINFINPFGDNLCGQIPPASLDRIRRSEVWAYVLQPNTGGAPGSYNPAYNYTKPHSDSDNPTNSRLKAPAAHYGIMIGAGNDGTDIASAAYNTTDSDFAPDNRDGAVKGIFSVPPIGATVAVSFINGKRGLPIVLGTLMGAEGIASVFGAGGEKGPLVDYPGVRQGIPGPQTETDEMGTSRAIASNS